MNTPISPYAATLGDRRASLHPTLVSYFDTIPEGHVGFGDGVFEVVGTPRRWLHPFLRFFESRGVVPAGYWRDVAFTVENRTVGGSARAIRTFALPHGAFEMTDVVTRTDRGVIDTLGSPPTVAAAFRVDVDAGALMMRSTRVGLRIGSLRITIPAWCQPKVRLIERFDEPTNKQRMSLTIDAPVIGRVYEYRGWFTYQIVKETR